MISTPIVYDPDLPSLARAEGGKIIVGWQFVHRAPRAVQVAILLHEEGHLLDTPCDVPLAANDPRLRARELWAWQYALEMIEFFAVRYPNPLWAEAYCYAVDAAAEWDNRS